MKFEDVLPVIRADETKRARCVRWPQESWIGFRDGVLYHMSSGLKSPIKGGWLSLDDIADDWELEDDDG